MFNKKIYKRKLKTLLASESVSTSPRSVQLQPQATCNHNILRTKFLESVIIFQNKNNHSHNVLEQKISVTDFQNKVKMFQNKNIISVTMFQNIKSKSQCSRTKNNLHQHVLEGKTHSQQSKKNCHDVLEPKYLSHKIISYTMFQNKNNCVHNVLEQTMISVTVFQNKT